MAQGHDGKPQWLFLMRDIKIRHYSFKRKDNPYLKGWETNVADEETPLAPVHLGNEGARKGWDTIRGEILARDNYRCVQCDSAEQVEVHHRRRRSLGGSAMPSNLETLCQACHDLKTWGKRRNSS
jgi:hypothetical protein